MKTTIKISQELSKDLNQLKYRYGFKTIEQVINHYINKKEEDNKNGKSNKMAIVEDQEQNS